MGWAEKRVGAERIKGAYAWKSLLKTQVHLPLSSDFPGETLNPFYGVYAAITRQDTEGNPAGGWQPEQRLTLDEALRGYTREGAFAEFEEKQKGTLEPGKLADLIVIDKDITQLESRPKEILSIRVVKTFTGGKLVFEAANTAQVSQDQTNPRISRVSEQNRVALAPGSPYRAGVARAGVDVPSPVSFRHEESWQKNEENRNQPRPRARDMGITIGVLPPGSQNAITDVAGIKVGHTTLITGENVRTGVTAILPHGGNLFREKVPGAVFVGNAFGKLIGSTQVNELGEIETPILLTSTLATPRVADALISYMLGLKGNEDVQSVNPLVGETNDGYLNDIRSRPITEQDVFAAIGNARDGPVDEGCVGAGTGTIAFGFKGGIGTSSRRLPAGLGGYTVGVLVQSNFGGILTIAGAPVGRELGMYYLKDQIAGQRSADQKRQDPNGSVMIVVATDAPIDHRNLSRLAARAMLGLGRTGSSGSNGSGDFVIAFSTGPDLRIPGGSARLQPKPLGNEAMSPLFEAVIEATEEAIYNSLFRACDMSGRGHTVKALPLKETLEVLRKYGVVSRSDQSRH
jgi:D-aminopeptidase